VDEDDLFRTQSWVKFLKEHWGGAIVLNGIQAMEDALKCIEVGV
jgi:isopentenyl diphosphate isomerase/L-lactate dehydrogenase-like FMN-dependent dehydrogenase